MKDKRQTELYDDDLDHIWDTPTWPQIIATCFLIGLGIIGAITLL